MLVGAPKIGTAATVGAFVLVTALFLLRAGKSAGVLLSHQRPAQPLLLDQPCRSLVGETAPYAMESTLAETEVPTPMISPRNLV